MMKQMKLCIILAQRPLGNISETFNLDNIKHLAKKRKTEEKFK